MKPIGYYLSSELPQDVETYIDGLDYDQKIGMAQDLLEAGEFQVDWNETTDNEALTAFLFNVSHEEWLRLAAGLIFIAIDESEQAFGSGRYINALLDLRLEISIVPPNQRDLFHQFGTSEYQNPLNDPNFGVSIELGADDGDPDIPF
jgi:hypothetical protein